jgi:23S rRNA pseudoU1915 N3-methylase RlmH
MISIYYIADSSKHFETAIKEYEKRLQKDIKITKIKPTKNGTQSQIIQKDTENINKLLKKQTNTFNIMLSLK